MPTMVPIIDQSRPWKMWYSGEVYTGPSGLGRYVPNVNDAVWDWALGLHRVSDVDYTTGLSTWVRHNFQNNVGGVVDTDVLLGSGPGAISESYRLYINTEVVPHVMAFDSRLRIYGTTAHHIKVFRGTDVSEATGVVISARFNVNNVMISENILLENVVAPGVGQVAVKTPGIGSVIETLMDGDVATAVIYSSTGDVVQICQMLVKNTDFIRTSDASKKYVIGIDLVSSFISPSDSHRLQYPINLPVQSAGLQGRVRYNDGSELLLPIDGTRFQVHGLDSYVAAVVGQTVPLVVTYHLASNEFAYGVSGVLPDRFLTQLYTLETVEKQGIYSVKLFVAPYWQSTGTQQWKLRYFLYNLDRQEILDATPYVEYGAMSAHFDGLSIGPQQDITVAVNLQSINPTFNYFRHVQTFSITMHALGTNAAAGTYYTLEYTPGDVLGTGLKAVGSASLLPNEWKLDVSNGYASLNDWLDAIYAPAEAMFLFPSEIQAPTPTHFRLRIGGTNFSVEVSVSQFATLIDHIPVEPLQGKDARLEFFKQVGVDKFELASVALTIQR